MGLFMSTLDRWMVSSCPLRSEVGEYLDYRIEINKTVIAKSVNTQKLNLTLRGQNQVSVKATYTLDTF